MKRWFVEKTGCDGPYMFSYRNGKLSIVLDDKRRIYLFHSTILKPYRRSNIAITDLLNPTNYQSSFLQTNLVGMIHEKHDARFTESRQKELNRIVFIGCVNVLDEYSLPQDSNTIGKRLVLCLKTPGTEEQSC